MSEDYDDAPEGVDDAPVDVIDAANPTPNTNDLADDAGAETDDEPEAEQPKPRRSAQERINEAVKAQRDAEREAAYWRGKASSEREPEREQPRAPADPEPDPAEFTYGETDPGYIKALGAHAARQEHARLRAEDSRHATVERVEQSWEQRQAAFAKDKPDFFQATTAKDLPITPVMANAIKTSEDGPAVAYHLAQNPDEARRIANLPPLAQVRELGKLEGKLAPPASAPTVKSVSDAPPPHPQARGQGGRFRPDPGTTDFAAFERLADAGG